jgi:hypothetical protein
MLLEYSLLSLVLHLKPSKPMDDLDTVQLKQLLGYKHSHSARFGSALTEPLNQTEMVIAYSLKINIF